MILKVSHLVFSSTHFEENSVEFNSLGYRCIFTEKNIENSIVKKPLFHHFHLRHDVRYFTSPFGVGVELLDWKSQSGQQSNFVPVFDNLSPLGFMSLTPKQLTTPSFFSFSPRLLKTLQIPIFTLQEKNAPAQLNSLLVKTDNFEKSIAFWKNFRFVVKEEYDTHVILELSSLLPLTPVFRLYLERAEEINRHPCLDDRGVSCISFLSSSANREKDLLKSKGLPIIDVGNLLINRKMLTVFFTVGPNGELVEVIDVKEVDS